MSRAGVVALVLLASGCSVLFKPDRDAIPDDLDAGPDATVDGFVPPVDAGDAGVDASPFDGGCPAQFELSCSDGIDNDCNGVADCNDLACASSGACCDVSTSSVRWDIPESYVSGYWATVPTTGPALSPTANRITFGTVSHPRALLLSECAPLAYGSQIDVRLGVTSGGPDDHYAALVLTPVTDVAEGSRLPAELAIRVTGTPEIIVERAGTVIAGPFTYEGTTLDVSVSLVPGYDDLGRAVLLASIDAGEDVDIDDFPLMPLADLVGPERGCTLADGLFLALEGRGNSITVETDPAVRNGTCANPSQFLGDDGTPAFPVPGSDALAAGGWRAGGTGEPAAIHFQPGVTQRLELFVDAAREERADETLRPIPFAIGGAYQLGASAWTPRTKDALPELVGPAPSSREPSVTAWLDAGGGTTQLYLAWVEESETPGRYDLRLALLGTAAADPLQDRGEFAADTLGCDSIRDPSLAALGASVSTGGLLVLYTCENDGERDRIEAAHFTGDGSTFTATRIGSLLDHTIGSYAVYGVFSPEVVVTPEGADRAVVRVWFLARDAAGTFRVAFATGELAAIDDLTLTPYPGNPILAPDDAVLGNESCALGCTLESLAVTPTLRTGAADRWPDPRYLVLIDRTRYTATDVVHELIPLLQVRPTD